VYAGTVYFLLATAVDGGSAGSVKSCPGQCYILPPGRLKLVLNTVLPCCIVAVFKMANLLCRPGEPLLIGFTFH